MPDISFSDQKDRILHLRSEIKALEAQIDALKEELKEAENVLMADMDEEGMRTLAFTNVSVIINHRSVAQLVDWELFNRYVLDNEALYLLHRRVSNKPIVEAHEQGLIIPGTSVQTVRSLTVKATR